MKYMRSKKLLKTIIFVSKTTIQKQTDAAWNFLQPVIQELLFQNQHPLYFVASLFPKTLKPCVPFFPLINAGSQISATF